jgi:hypothetical protein
MIKVRLKRGRSLAWPWMEIYNVETGEPLNGIEPDARFHAAKKANVGDVVELTEFDNPPRLDTTTNEVARHTITVQVDSIEEAG